MSRHQQGVRTEEHPIRVRNATREDIPEIVWVSNSSILPGGDFGFGGGTGSPFHEESRLESSWQEPNVVHGEEVLVAEMESRIVGCATVQDRGAELELVNIDVPLELQGKGIGTRLVRSVEERARREGKRAVTLGTSRNAAGVAWKSLPWWQRLGYRITHEEENDWTRSIGPGVREIRMRKRRLITTAFCWLRLSSNY
jgi:N-acetylglutamate synthase-like GNAT family acetyltransferase